MASAQRRAPHGSGSGARLGGELGSDDDGEGPLPTRWAKSFGQAAHDTLADCDGVSTRLYYYLWRKNAAGKTPAQFRIPDTIVYKYRLPAFWFFTSAQDGQIMKKKQINVVGPKIIESFTKKKSCAADDAPCAVHIFTDSAERQARLRGARPVAGPAASLLSVPPAEPDAAHVLVVDFLDAEGLDHFLLHTEKQQDALLQRFVAPRGTCHSVIRATWTPAVCLLERRTNRRQLGDASAPLPSRCVTFEGSDADATSEPLHSTALAERVRGAANALVAHVAEVTGGGSIIARAVLHFMLAADDALYFLYATSLRLRPGHGRSSGGGASPGGMPPLASSQAARRRSGSGGSAGSSGGAAGSSGGGGSGGSGGAAGALARLALRPPVLPHTVKERSYLSHAIDLDPVFSTNAPALALQEERLRASAAAGPAGAGRRDSVALAASKAAAAVAPPPPRTAREEAEARAARDAAAAAAEARRRELIAAADAKRHGDAKPPPVFRAGRAPPLSASPSSASAVSGGGGGGGASAMSLPPGEPSAPPAPPPRRPDTAKLAALSAPPKRSPPPAPRGFEVRPVSAAGPTYRVRVLSQPEPAPAPRREAAPLQAAYGPAAARVEEAAREAARERKARAAEAAERAAEKAAGAARQRTPAAASAGGAYGSAAAAPRRATAGAPKPREAAAAPQPSRKAASEPPPGPPRTPEEVIATAVAAARAAQQAGQLDGIVPPPKK